MTIELPTDVTFGVTGEALTLTCQTSEPGLTQFAFYRDNVQVQSLGASNTYNAPDAASYHCIAANDDGTQKTAATAQQVIAFKSKSFHIHHPPFFCSKNSSKFLDPLV